MRIAFCGTGEFSQNILEALLQDPRIQVELVVSQADKPVGRKKELQKTPVKLLAEKYNIDIEQPEKLKKNEEFLEKLEGLHLDFIVVVAYGKIVPERVLNAAKHGCINLHGSILPAYRGASPIQAAVKNGESETGLTLMYMSKGMDEGDILKIEKTLIDKEDTTPDIFRKFEKNGPELIIQGLEDILLGTLIGVPQNDAEATYCGKISKQDGEIDFSQSAQSIYNMFRAYTPWPGIFTYYNGTKFQIEECEGISDVGDENNSLQAGDVFKRLNELGKAEICVKCEKGALILKRVKLAGKKSMDILSFINGNKDFLDYKFGGND